METLGSAVVGSAAEARVEVRGEVEVWKGEVAAGLDVREGVEGEEGEEEDSRCTAWAGHWPLSPTSTSI
ncbi:unnamed protein product [Closterium sp. NIES-53]